MKSTDGVMSLELDSREALKVHKALSAEQRVKILGLLAKQPMNINEIASALQISKPTASVHVRLLQNAGLIDTEYVPTERGSEKRCRISFRKLVFEANVQPETDAEMSLEIPMPIGLFTRISVESPCGLADENGPIGYMDNPECFHLAERAYAQLVWFRAGWVEYTFASNLPPSAEVTSLEFSCELCSETTQYNNEWPSDITVWVNGVEVGTWMSPGDFGGTRGKLNPSWWPDSNTQFGMLKCWTVDDTGSRVDGMQAEDASLSDLGICYQSPIVVRIGNKHDAAHIGGVNLFGRHFGNYPQDLTLRLRYKLRGLVR